MLTRPCLLLASLLLALCACASLQRPGETQGRWIRVDPATQRYSISAQRVSRGDLLDEVARLSGVEVRPQPGRDEALSIEAQDLGLAELVGRLVPGDARSVTRWGEREVSAAGPRSDQRKQGPPLQASPGLIAKGEKETPLLPSGNLKKSPEAAITEPRIEGPRAKPPADAMLRVAESKEPKRAVSREVERGTVRVTLEFESDAPPRVIAAQSIEGRATADRFTRGTHLFAVVAPDGRLLQYGSFQDPLVEHSYLPEGPHDVRRARSGVAGISILRENLAGARLLIVDASALTLPRELNEEVVRAALARGKTLTEIDTARILRSLDQGVVK